MERAEISEQLDGITDSVIDLVESHMKKQPYSITCNDCGEDLKYSATVDADHDLSIVVEPCEACLAEAKEPTP